MKSFNLNFSAISKFRTEIMGFACIWVVFHHFEGDISSLFLRRFSVYGNAGVDIFLFLSGIGLYFAFQKKEPLSLFYKKRVVRLFLPYLFICVPFFIWRSLYLGEGNLILDITQLSFPLSGMITTWYVPAMLIFYLVFPLVYHYQNGSCTKNRFVGVAVFCFLYFNLLLIINDLFPTFYGNTEIATVRFIIFFIGCFLGKAVYEKRDVPITWALFTVFGGFMCVYLREEINLSALWIRLCYGLMAIALCLIFSYLFGLLKGQNPLLVILRFFGNHSLEIYLTHVIIRNVWRSLLGTRFLSSNGALDYLVVVLIAVLVSVPIHFLVSKLASLIIKK